MSNLTNEQLAELTALVNARLDEFEGDFGHFTRGHVRLVHDVVMAFWDNTEKLAVWPKPVDPIQGDPMYDGFLAGMVYMRDKRPAEPNGHVNCRCNEHVSAEPVDFREFAEPATTPAPDEADDDRARVKEFIAQALAEPTIPVTDDDLGDGPDPTREAVAEAEQVDDDGGDVDDPVPARQMPPPKTDEKLTSSPAPQPQLSPTAAATLGPEHTVVTPLRTSPDRLRSTLPDPDVAREKLAAAVANGSHALVEAINKPRTLAEVDAERAARTAKGRTPNRGTVLPTLDQMIAEVRRQSMGGAMPSQHAFNAAKPANWSMASAQLLRLGISWEELADRAGLKPNRRDISARSAA